MAAAANGSTNLTRIGVFYDGNYFLHVSNYYHYVHDRRSRLSLKGLHEYIRQQISQLEDKEVRLCRVVDSHYFRGRLSASEASQRGNLLYYERVFDDILMGEGIVSHYLPVKIINGRRQEKGIDVWLSLEAIEMAFNNHFDVVVLVGSDSDYVPLMRKLNGMGKHTILLSWDFEYTDEEGHRFSTRTSQDLLEEVTYSLPMHEIIDDLAENEFDLNRLFVPNSSIRHLEQNHWNLLNPLLFLLQLIWKTMMISFSWIPIDLKVLSYLLKMVMVSLNTRLIMYSSISQA